MQHDVVGVEMQSDSCLDEHSQTCYSKTLTSNDHGDGSFLDQVYPARSRTENMKDKTDGEMCSPALIG